MRLITRGDLDGLTGAVLVTSMESIDGIELVHPKDMQDSKVAVTNKDIIVNLPYHPKCAKWFDHHFGTEEAEVTHKFDGRYGVAPSASRLVFEYYDHPSLDKFGELVSETDRVDAAQLTMEDIVNPKRYVLLSYTLDPRTGLGGAFRTYFHNLLDWIKVHPINEVLAMPEVAEKVREIRDSQKTFEKELRKHSKVDGNVVLTDFRRKAKRPVGNRFLVYALYPEANVWMNVFGGHSKETIVIALGHSILNRTCNTNIGELCAEFGGGGHRGAGTCQVSRAKAKKTIDEILGRLKANG
jgi:hypothetical protein